MIRHHPGEDLILAYAGGAGDEATSLIVATHLGFCAECRRAVALAETMGGALMQSLAPAPLSGGALAATLARLDAPLPPVSARLKSVVQPKSKDGTPSPLRAYLGGDLSQVRWRRMGASLAWAPLFRRGGVKVKLLKGVAGSDTGLHSHRGLEFTLVLQGGFTDESGSYAPGDLQVAASDIWHNPVADPGEDCINLSVTTAPLKFKGLVPKIAGRLAGF
jgi:putative transcriptional regulator